MAGIAGDLDEPGLRERLRGGLHPFDRLRDVEDGLWLLRVFVGVNIVKNRVVVDDSKALAGRDDEHMGLIFAIMLCEKACFLILEVFSPQDAFEVDDCICDAAILAEAEPWRVFHPATGFFVLRDRELIELPRGSPQRDLSR